MYLSKSELNTVAPIALVEALADMEDDLVETLILENIDLMKGYFQGRYDAEAIFAKEGDGRDKVVLKYLKDLVLHDLHVRHARGKGNELIRQRYEDALQWLQGVGQGLHSPDLSRKEEADRGSVGSFRLGSKPPYPTSR